MLYENREVFYTACFAPDRAYARRIHHLSVAQYGDEPAHNPVTRTRPREAAPPLTLKQSHSVPRDGVISDARK